MNIRTINWIKNNRYRVMLLVLIAIFIGNNAFADAVGAFNYQGLSFNFGPHYYTCLCINVLSGFSMAFIGMASIVNGEWDYDRVENETVDN